MDSQLVVGTAQVQNRIFVEDKDGSWSRPIHPIFPYLVYERTIAVDEHHFADSLVDFVSQAGLPIHILNLHNLLDKSVGSTFMCDALQ